MRNSLLSNHESSALILPLRRVSSSNGGSNPAIKTTFDTLCIVAEEMTPESASKMMAAGNHHNMHPQMMIDVRRKSSF